MRGRSSKGQCAKAAPFVTLVARGSKAVSAETYHLVIVGGRVTDPETHYDAVANVGIKDGRIAVITKSKIEGKQAIDAKGLVVAPGLIDRYAKSSVQSGDLQCEDRQRIVSLLT